MDKHRSMLLGSNGVDLTDLDQDVEVLTSSANLHPLEPISDTDIQVADQHFCKFTPYFIVRNILIQM